MNVNILLHVLYLYVFFYYYAFSQRTKDIIWNAGMHLLQYIMIKIIRYRYIYIYKYLFNAYFDF